MLNFQWSDGFNGAEHQVSPSQNTTYSLTVSNICYSKTANVDIMGCPNLSGEFPRLNYPPSMKSNSNSISQWLVISNMNVPAGTPNGYHATGYRLEVVDRWGTVHKVVQEQNNCDGFNNSTIYWNGRINGNPVQDGLYTFMLTLYNDTYPWNGHNSNTLITTNLTPDGGKKMLDWYAFNCPNASHNWHWNCFCYYWECNGGSWGNFTQWYGKILISN